MSNRFLQAESLLDQPANAARLPATDLQLKHQRPYWAEGVSQTGCILAVPLRQKLQDHRNPAASGWGLAYQQLKLPRYREWSAVVIYGRQILKDLYLGVSAGAGGKKLPENDPQRSLHAQLGFVWRYGQWCSGGGILLQQYIDVPEIAKPAAYSFLVTAGRDLSREAYAGLELGFTPQGVSVKTAILFRPLQQVQAAVQLQTLPVRLAVETGYIQKRWQVFLYGMMVPALGWTPGLRLGFGFPAKTITHE